MLSDILPTGFECGVLNGQVKPGDTVAIVGAGPVGLAVLLTAQFYSPAAIFMIDLDDKRLAVAKKFGATNLINSVDGHAAHQVMELTEGAGVDVAIEAVGLPATFEICQAIVAAGGRIANVGVHGKPVELPGPTRLLDYVGQLGVDPHAIAVEVNGEILERDAYADCTLAGGDAVEIVRMVGGGVVT